MKAKDLMSSRVVTVRPGNSIRHAAQLMLDHAISGLPVVDDDGKLVGMITEGDLLRRNELGQEHPAGARFAAGQAEHSSGSYLKTHGWSVGDVMTSDVITVQEEATAADVAQLMKRHGIKRLPVMREGRLAGIVSRADLLVVITLAKPDDTAPGDAAIRRSILARLGESAGLESSHIAVAVTNGAVHLSGSVNSAIERDVARAVAENVHGVANVYNHLQIATQPVGISAGNGSPRSTRS
ncbi:MAG: CBS domain-containing protein [Rhizobiales bacterium]|nr:CBS domain-containing protein [Hyphomicrobiales bacterium]MBI3674866.1 CBS domain-containing protein [Hyphomicrobiales bacterium]